MTRLVREESRTLRRALIAAALLLVLPASANATTVKQYKPKAQAACRTQYVKRRETVKEHKHRKVVKVKETFCVYVAPKTTTPTTTAATPALAVHLDPSFTQSPTNPLVVTYSYSASATIGGSADLSLPAGVLEFFSDGLLVCSENVGGQTDGGTCGVTYSAYGTHTVNVIYDSGTNSATTGNETEDIEPPPPFATTTSLTVAFNGCEEVGVPTWTTARDECSYTLTSDTTDALGAVTGGTTYLTLSPGPSATNGGVYEVDGESPSGCDTGTGDFSCTLALVGQDELPLNGEYGAPDPQCDADIDEEVTAEYHGGPGNGVSADLPSQSATLQLPDPTYQGGGCLGSF